MALPDSTRLLLELTVPPPAVVLHQANPQLLSTSSTKGQTSRRQQQPSLPQGCLHLPPSSLHGAVQAWHIQWPVVQQQLPATTTTAAALPVPTHNRWVLQDQQ